MKVYNNPCFSKKTFARICFSEFGEVCKQKCKNVKLWSNENKKNLLVNNAKMKIKTAQIQI